MPQDTFPPAAPPRQNRRKFGSARSIVALIMREMATTYGRSPGGYVWAIVEPAAAVALMTVIFTAFLRNPSLGISFPMFYSSGILPFLLYIGVQMKVAGGLTYSKALLAYPTVTYLDSLLARFILEVITKLLVGYIVFSTILILYETRVSFDFMIIFKSYALAALLGISIGSVNCVVMTRFSVYQRLWSVFTAPLFILSGIFYILEDLPENFQDILWYNPLVHITATMRSGFYSTYNPDWVSDTYVITIALVCLALGLLMLRRFHRDLLAI